MEKKFIYGLEIHVQLNTKYKLFSNALNIVNAIENQHVDITDLGMPGTYVRVNAKAIYKALKACKLLNMQISNTITFDRKHYKYHDLPAGYQITQFNNPIGKNGEYNIGTQIVKIQDIHIESDAAKIKEYDTKYVIDYNRLGIPLIEIVTTPCFDSLQNIELFVLMLIQDLRDNNISNAKFEMSQIRIDLNLSYKSHNYQSPRLEIKNINSLKNMKKAALLSSKLYEIHAIQRDYTVHYDDITNTVTLARPKEHYLDYLYIHEYAIPTIHTNNLYTKHINIKHILLYIQRIKTLVSQPLSFGVIKTIIENNIIIKIIVHYTQQYKQQNYDNVIHYILEIKEVLKYIEDKQIEVIIYLLHMLYMQQILKQNIKLIMLQIQQQKIITKEELDDYLTKNNMKMLTTNVQIQKIHDYINNLDNDLLNRIQDKKIFNYILGLLIKQFRVIPPSQLIQILKQYVK